MTGHVFISHASENRDEANELVTLIEAKGMKAWIAPRDVRPGFDYSEELQAAVEGCTAFVVLVTDAANKSPYVRAETEMAFSCNKPMLPVRISEIGAGPGLAFFLKIRNWTDAYGPGRDTNLGRLVLELQTLTGTAPSWAPQVGPAAPPMPSPASVPAAPATAVSAGPAVAPQAATPSNPLVPLVLVGGGLAVVLILATLWSGSVFTPPGVIQTNMFPSTPPPRQDEPQQPQRAYAGEMVDFGIPPKAELETNVGTPTPMTIPVGQRLTTGDVQRMLGQSPRPILIDVLNGTHAQTLPDALFMPAGGMPGTFDDANQTQFAQQLGQAIAGDSARPLVFFCQGASCWESYNAALRANAAGYGNIYWYRGGLSAWQEAGLAMSATPAPYGEAGQGY